MGWCLNVLLLKKPSCKSFKAFLTSVLDKNLYQVYNVRFLLELLSSKSGKHSHSLARFRQQITLFIVITFLPRNSWGNLNTHSIKTIKCILIAHEMLLDNACNSFVESGLHIILPQFNQNISEHWRKQNRIGGMQKMKNSAHSCATIVTDIWIIFKKLHSLWSFWHKNSVFHMNTIPTSLEFDTVCLWLRCKLNYTCHITSSGLHSFGWKSHSKYSTNVLVYG